jgi:signal transduction histidine kinase
MSPGGHSKKKGGLPTGSTAGLPQKCPGCGALVVGARERIVACTAGAAAQLRTRAARLKNASVNSLPAPLPEMIRAAARSGRAVSNREIEIKPSRGGATTLRVGILPAKSAVVVVLNNPAFASASHRNLRRLDQLASLGMLSASMAHEIKNALVGLKTFVDLLALKHQEAELTALAGHELERINTIAMQMLRIAAPRSGAFANVRVHDLLDRSLRLMQHQFDERLILVRRNFQAAPDTVRGDDAQLQQVLLNLLLNAIEAMGAHGVLTVDTEATDGGQLKIQIRDTGTGIAPKHLARLFEPFFTTKKNGTGLGLTISKRIALEHRGTIEVQSETGKGSTFTLSLPAV